MRVKMTLPREVEVVRCDAPGCDNWCEAPDPTLPSNLDDVGSREYTRKYGPGCDWLALPQSLHASISAQHYPGGGLPDPYWLKPIRSWTECEPVYLCSWDCLLKLIQVRAGIEGRDPRPDSPYNLTTPHNRLLPLVQDEAA